jgi:membrane protein YdbS with pleckstrin-like domain
MPCSKCGADVPAEARFCPSCGAAVGEPALAPANPQPAAAATPAERLRGFSAEQRTAAAVPTEKELWVGSYSPKDMFGPAAGVAALTVAAIIAGTIFQWTPVWLWALLAIVAMWAALGLLLVYRRLSIRYRLTNQRFFHERGLLTRVVDRIEVIDMDDITFVQGLVDRMLGIGTIRVTSSDRTHPELLVRGIDHVRQVAALMDNARREERMRRGVHIEAI